jgi:hypothetical protein
MFTPCENTSCLTPELEYMPRTERLFASTAKWFHPTAPMASFVKFAGALPWNTAPPKLCTEHITLTNISEEVSPVMVACGRKHQLLLSGERFSAACECERPFM